jgi:hypothetical protein
MPHTCFLSNFTQEPCSDRALGGFLGCTGSDIQRARVQNHGCRRAGAGETGYELGLAHRFVHKKDGRWHHRMLDAWLVPSCFTYKGTIKDVRLELRRARSNNESSHHDWRSSGSASLADLPYVTHIAARRSTVARRVCGIPRPSRTTNFPWRCRRARGDAPGRLRPPDDTDG